MKALFLASAILAMVAQAYSQCIPSCTSAVAPIYAPSCGCPAPTVVAAPAPMLAPVVATNSVAANLADTLSLLTVTTLLAETLPYSCPGCASSYPYPYPYPGCGCGYGYVL